MKPIEILLVEDHYIMRKFIENYLSKNNIVVSKSNGLEAIKWLESGNRPQVIVCDLSMPEMDGRDFIEYVKCTEFYSPEHEFSVSWNDPDLGIPWPLEILNHSGGGNGVELSAKDKAAPRLRDIDPARLPVYK